MDGEAENKVVGSTLLTIKLTDSVGNTSEKPIILEIYCPPNDASCGNGPVVEVAKTTIQTDTGTLDIPIEAKPEEL